MQSKNTNFQAYYKKTNKEIDLELQSLTPLISDLNLRKQVEYALETKGKRLRATLVLLSGQSVGGKKQHLKKLALAIELLHLASLVHDDILDEDLFRRNAVSVYAKWSVKEAIMVGDILASISFSLCKGYKREILDIMIDTCVQLSDGQYNDVKLGTTLPTEKEYFQKIEKKSAPLFQAACECGALAANGSHQETETLKLFGINYGVAFQIKDDILDAQTSGNDLHPTANKFRATLPIIHACQNIGKEKRKYLENLLAEKTKESLKTFVEEVRLYFEKSDSFDYCVTKMNEYVGLAVANLSPLKESAFKNRLIYMAKSLRFEKGNRIPAIAL